MLIKETDDMRTAAVLNEFIPLAAIPRPSGREEAVAAYLLDWAAGQNLSAQKDDANNVRIDIPASAGCEQAPRVLFQAHTDMVCVAVPGKDFVPARDSIELVREGDLLHANGTSLGADNGIGVAMILALIKNLPAQHGPLRALFTSEEETHMGGAVQLDPSWLEGSYCINLDSEEFGVLTNSSAASRLMYIDRPAEWNKPVGTAAFHLVIDGLRGGHSGININEDRGNAMRMAAFILAALKRQGIAVELAPFSCGTADNAIPSLLHLVFAIDGSKKEQALACLEASAQQARETYRHTEKKLVIRLEDISLPEQVLSTSVSSDIIDFVCLAPIGVHTMSPFVAGLVESSANLGVTRVDKNIHLVVYARSSEPGYTEELDSITRTAAERTGFHFSVYSDMAGWPLNPDSQLVPMVCELFQQVSGKEMVVAPIHAGLECGCFAAKNPQLEIVSIGPELQNVHSPAECLHVNTLPVYMKLLDALLEKFAQKQ